MKKPSRRTQKILVAATTPVAVVLSAAMVYQASYAAFSGTTRNSGNDWSTGTVTLTDDDGGAARFQVTNMLPDQTETKCIKVTANATVDSTVRGYTLNPSVTAARGLENRIFVKILSGNGGTFADCTGWTNDSGLPDQEATLAQLATKNSFANGIGGWAVTAGTSTKTYKISWRFDTTGMSQSAVDAMQGASTGIDVQWEMQNN